MGGRRTDTHTVSLGRKRAKRSGCDRSPRGGSNMPFPPALPLGGRSPGRRPTPAGGAAEPLGQPPPRLLPVEPEVVLHELHRPALARLAARGVAEVAPRRDEAGGYLAVLDDLPRA